MYAWKVSVVPFIIFMKMIFTSHLKIILRTISSLFTIVIYSSFIFKKTLKFLPQNSNPMYFYKTIFSFNWHAFHTPGFVLKSESVLRMRNDLLLQGTHEEWRETSKWASALTSTWPPVGAQKSRVMGNLLLHPDALNTTPNQLLVARICGSWRITPTHSYLPWWQMNGTIKPKVTWDQKYDLLVSIWETPKGHLRFIIPHGIAWGLSCNCFEGQLLFPPNLLSHFLSVYFMKRHSPKASVCD